MNADRIIVISGGELAEQGSHEELIRTGGKYADLWSKQVFTKPKKPAEAKDEEEEGQQEGKRRKAVGSLVNDLSQETTKAELAKVKTATTEPESEDTAKDTEQDVKDVADVKTPTGHKKEV